MSYWSQKAETKYAIQLIKEARSQINQIEPQILNSMNSDQQIIAKSIEWRGELGNEFRRMAADLTTKDKNFYDVGCNDFKICLIDALYILEDRLEYLQYMINKLSNDD
jgi:hypothetical protein